MGSLPQYGLLSPSDVEVSGGYAHIADGVGGLNVIDITDPASPAPLGVLETPGGARVTCALDVAAPLLDDLVDWNEFTAVNGFESPAPTSEVLHFPVAVPGV